VTDGDLRRNFDKVLSGGVATDIMTKAPKTVSENSLAAEALSLFPEYRITALFILNETGQPVGLIHVHDCLSVGVV